MGKSLEPLNPFFPVLSILYTRKEAIKTKDEIVLNTLLLRGVIIQKYRKTKTMIISKKNIDT
jgi:hypothetical protein